MSVFSIALAAAHAALATAKGESIGYRVGTSGAFTTLAGFILIQDRVPAFSQDGDHHDEVQVRSGTLKGPVTPAMVKGYQIQDTITGYVWSVQAVKIDSQQVCLLELTQVGTLGPDRKGAR